MKIDPILNYVINVRNTQEIEALISFFKKSNIRKQSDFPGYQLDEIRSFVIEGGEVYGSRFAVHFRMGTHIEIEAEFENVFAVSSLVIPEPESPVQKEIREIKEQQEVLAKRLEALQGKV